MERAAGGGAGPSSGAYNKISLGLGQRGVGGRGYGFTALGVGKRDSR